MYVLGNDIKLKQEMPFIFFLILEINGAISTMRPYSFHFTVSLIEKNNSSLQAELSLYRVAVRWKGDFMVSY